MKELNVVLSVLFLKGLETETESICMWKPVIGAGYFAYGNNKIRDQNKAEILIIFMTINLRTFFRVPS
jgi:hypothetical protein